jgi:hypothetical protein
MERDRRDKEERERRERERAERERRERERLARDEVDRHFKLSMEFVHKVRPPPPPPVMNFYPIKFYSHVFFYVIGLHHFYELISVGRSLMEKHFCGILHLMF